MKNRYLAWALAFLLVGGSVGITAILLGSNPSGETSLYQNSETLPSLENIYSTADRMDAAEPYLARLYSETTRNIDLNLGTQTPITTAPGIVTTFPKVALSNPETLGPNPQLNSPQTTAKAPSNLSYEEQVVVLVNEQRAANGLKPLTHNSKLSDVARTKSQDMLDKKYFSHTSPTYGSPFDMMKTFGISYRAAGENIAMGQRTPEEVMKSWMNSSGHRANILSSSFAEIGVGYVSNGHYWTQMFIG